MEDTLASTEPSRKDLIHALHDAQERHGHVPAEAIAAIARRLRITETDVYGVLTFYKAFSLEPKGRHVVTICSGTACHVRGAARIIEEFERALDVPAGRTTPDREFTLETVNCVGACALGPIVIIDGDYHGQAKAAEIPKLVEDCRCRSRGQAPCGGGKPEDAPVDAGPGPSPRRQPGGG
ncbi:MAG: NAD(P)H-dependent oxidoreductase subunit E [Elusimicrobia bacterium]|nr:NAD(P)H-dependent oxidoreductase subunit E [Elusimicrobiota bacterium]